MKRLLLVCLLLLAGCRPGLAVSSGGEPASATSTSEVTATPLTATATPTSTTTPAPSPSPTVTLTPTATEVPLTTLLFTGVIVPARCVQAAIDLRGDHDYPYAEVRETIQGADLAIGTFNATMSRLTPHTGCVSTYLLVGDPENADAMANAGFDLMSVATNHIKNCGVNRCGDKAFFDTLDNLRRVGITTIGAGKDLAEAMQPVVVAVNGVRFGFVSLGQIEPTTFAGEDTPGIAVLNEANLRAAIAAARKVSDVVIAMPHWGPEDEATPGYIQQNLAKVAVEAGADLVVGNHTHVVQAIQEIAGVQVFYGLGNFVFDQDLRDHRQGAILLVRFRGKAYEGYELIPTHVDGDGTVHIAGEEEAREVLERVREVSEGLR